MKPFALLAILMLSVLPAAARARADKMPKLDVESSCREAKIYGMTNPEETFKNCMLDEEDARKQLEQHWSHYKPATKRNCLAAGAQPSPSYVELLTCIEVTEETLTPPTGGMGVPVVPAGKLGSPPPRPPLSPGPRAMPP